MKPMRNIMIIGLTMLVISATVSFGSTIVVSDTSANPGDTDVLVTISLDNLVPYSGFEIAIEYNTALLNLNRIEPAPRLSSQSGTGFYEFTKGIMSVLVFDFDGASLPPGSDPILNAYFDVSSDSSRARAYIFITDVTAVLENMEYDSVSVQDGYIQIPIGPSCQYVAGDANNSASFTGLDVTYSVRYFKGGPLPPYSCDCPPHGVWYVAGDVNGSCTFSGLDVTKMIRHFKYYDPVYPCPDCPPSGLLAPPIPKKVPTPTAQPKLVPTLKAKGVIKASD